MCANRRLSLAVLFVAFLALVGCGKSDVPPPDRAPTESKGESEPGTITPPTPQPLPKDKIPVVIVVPGEPEPEPVPAVTDAEKARIEAAEKKGARVHGPQLNGGYDIDIIPNTDADAILALLKGLKCVIGLSCESDKLSDAAIKHLEGFDHLQTLILQRCSRVTGANFDVFAKLPRLKSLSLDGTATTDAACKALGQIKNLEVLNLRGTKVSDAGVRELSTLASLDTLTLEETAVTGTAFAALGWPKLKELDARNTPFADAGLKAVAGLPALEFLNLDSTKITDAGVGHLAGAKKLTSLALRRTATGDVGATAIGNIKTLKELLLTDTKVTDTGLAALAGLAALEELDAGGTAITGSGFAKFPPRPKLRKLTLNSTKFDDAGGLNLVKFPGLTRLDVSLCRTLSDKGLTPLKDATKLSWCDLHGTAAGDDTAKLLGTLPELVEARFVDTRLTDAGLRAVALAPKIRQIDARGTKATKEGAERAKMGRKNVDIHAD